MIKYLSGGLKMKNQVKVPNIIYILGDDHRQDYTGIAENPVIQTPNLDKLAADGFYFKNACCTSPLCTPSRACHYSGKWERAHGINFNSYSSMGAEAWSQTFPMLLKEQGYETAWIGKNHVPVGVDGYESGTMEESFDYWYGNHRHSFFYPKETERGIIYRNAKYDTQVEVFEEGAMNFLDPQDDFIESCTKPLIKRDKSKPFCMCVTFNLPHDSSTECMEQRESDLDIYKTLYRDKLEELPIPPTYIPYDQIKEPRLPKELYSGVYLECYEYVRSLESLKERQVRICQTVTGVDYMVGRVREKLEELGIADNTIIVFSTDHGIHHGEHGLGGKSFLYEEDLNIPMIIYDPRIEKQNTGKQLEQIVAVPDLAPTIMELAGFEPPKTMQGSSLVSLMKDEKSPWREELFIEQLFDNQNYPKSEGIKTKEWKYIRYFKRTEIPGNEAKFKITNDSYEKFLKNSHLGYREVAYEELYHLSEDPYEEKNLVETIEYEEKLQYFRTRILEMIAEYSIENVNEMFEYYEGEMHQKRPLDQK